MAAIITGGRAQATRSTGVASLRAKVSDVVRRAAAIGAAAVMAGAVGAALLQLVAQMLSFPAPVAVIGIVVMAAALLSSLSRHLRTGRVTITPGTPVASGGNPTASASGVSRSF